MKNVNLIKFQMADLRSLLTLICLTSGKSCQITRSLLLSKRCVFREEYVLKNVSSIKLTMADMQQLSTSKCVIAGKPYQVASPLP